MGPILFLAFEPCNGGPAVTLATVHDRGVLEQAARAAIKESRQREGSFRDEDATLGVLQREESTRLERALNIVLPDLGAATMARQTTEPEK